MFKFPTHTCTLPRAGNASICTAPSHRILIPASLLTASFPKAWNCHSSSVSLFNPPLTLQLMLRTNSFLNLLILFQPHSSSPSLTLQHQHYYSSSGSHLYLFCIYGNELLSPMHYSECHPIPNPHHTIKGQSLGALRVPSTMWGSN